MRHNKNFIYKMIPVSFSLCAVFGIFYALILSPNILIIFSPDDTLTDMTLKKLKPIRGLILSSSILLLIVSYLTYIFKTFNRINMTITTVFIGVIFSFWCIFIIEASLHIIPRNNTTNILARSLAFEPSSFSMSKFPLHHNVLAKDGRIKTKIRSGYRTDNEFGIDTSASKIVFIFGGSFVYDINARLSESWPELVSRHFEEDITIVNAGIPAHGTYDAIGKIIGEAHLYNPDYILLCNAWNDIKYFSELSLPNKSLLRTYPVYNKYSHENISFIRKIMEYSQIYLHLKYIFKSQNIKQELEGKVFSNEQSVNNKVSKNGLNQYKLNIETFIDVCRNIGAIPVLLTQPRLIAENNSNSDKAKIRYEHTKFDHDTLIDAFNKTDSIIFNVAQSKLVDIIDLATIFNGQSNLFSDHLHTTELGSQLIAKKTADALRSIIYK